MTETILIISNVALWVLVLLLLVVVLLIYKQVGELIIDRTVPSHDEQGPEVGEAAPLLAAFDLQTGEAVERQPENEVLVFAFPGCPGCEQIAEVLPILAKHRPDIGVTLLSVFAERDLERASDGVAGIGDIILPEALHSPEGREGITVMVAPTAKETSPHSTYGITATPFAILVDAQGRVAAKAILRSPEHLPQLIANDNELDTERAVNLQDSSLMGIGGAHATINRS